MYHKVLISDLTNVPFIDCQGRKTFSSCIAFYPKVYNKRWDHFLLLYKFLHFALSICVYIMFMYFYMGSLICLFFWCSCCPFIYLFNCSFFWGLIDPLFQPSNVLFALVKSFQGLINRACCWLHFTLEFYDVHIFRETWWRRMKSYSSSCLIKFTTLSYLQIKIQIKN